MTHEAFDTPAARGVPQVTQGGVDSRRTIAATMLCIEALDLGEQGAVCAQKSLPQLARSVPMSYGLVEASYRAANQYKSRQIMLVKGVKIER